MQRSVRLPRDEHAHRVQYEWWYAHGYLENEAGRRYGFMLCFFKFDAATIKRFFPQFKPYPAKMLYQMTLGLTDVTGQTHHFDEHTFVPWPGHVGARRFGKLNVFFGHNHLRRVAPNRFSLSMQHHHRHLRLHFYDRKGPVLHGTRGVLSFPKSGSTVYYSHPRLTVHGAFEAAGPEGKKEAEFVRGSGWIDHQWGDFAADQPFSFWNWTGIQLDDGSELMVYEPFLPDGTSAGCKVTWFGPKGERKVTKGIWKPGSHWTSPKSKITYPIDHQISVPALDLELTLRADVRDQEMYSSFFKYWEGSCSVIGKRAHKHITGKSYVELTGYDRLSPQGRRNRLGLKRQAVRP
ncbi:MAG: lipocalin family protein [Candidatus Andersenbacteria bacterium]